MGDFLRLILDWLKEIWPLRIVHQWERGAFYVCGRYWKEVGPGIYPLVPWFMSLHEVSAVPEPIESQRQDLTLADGRSVSFEFSAMYRVFDVNLAVNTIYDYERSTAVLIRAVLADKIASVKPERLLPEGRGRLLTDLRRWADEEAREFGIEVTKLRFASFVTNVKTIRVLGGLQ